MLELIKQYIAHERGLIEDHEEGRAKACRLNVQAHQYVICLLQDLEDSLKDFPKSASNKPKGQ